MRSRSNLHVLLAAIFLLLSTGALGATSLGSGAPAERPDRPVAVSPGTSPERLSNTSKVPTAAGRCPTFSWGVDERPTGASRGPGATRSTRQFELAVYRLADDVDSEATEVLRTRVSGLATSFTPALEECLKGGADYAWSVRAVTNGSAGGWSEPLIFQAPRPSDEIDLATALAIVKEHTEPQAEQPNGRRDTAVGAAYATVQGSEAAETEEPVSTDAPQRGAGATLRVSGQVLADAFSGDGSALSNLAPSSLTAGTAAIDISGSAATLSSTLPISQGGTGAVDAASARAQLGAAADADLVALAGDVAALAGDVELDECPAPFNSYEKVFTSEGGVEQRICATTRRTLSTPTKSVQSMVEDEIGALCSLWPAMNMQLFDRRQQEQLLQSWDLTVIRDALTSLEVLLENTLGSAFGAIDDLFNATDNAVEGVMNPMFNTIDGKACPGDCWPTNPINMPNLNLPNTWRNIDFEPFAGIVDIAETVLENPDAISLMCTDPELRETFVEQVIRILPESFGGGDQPAHPADEILTFTYQPAEATCAAMGGHVCSVPELYQLAAPAAPQAIGCQSGDWVQGGDLIATAFSQTRNLFETPWPPIEVDLSPLLAWPPGIPLSITWPILPSGGYRCCISTVDF